MDYYVVNLIVVRRRGIRFRPIFPARPEIAIQASAMKNPMHRCVDYTRRAQW